MDDVTTRASGGWRQEKGTIRNGTVEFDMIYDPADTDFAAFLTAAVGNSTIACAILDGARTTTGTQGLWADFEVSMNKTENLEEAQKVTVTLSPAYSAVAPEWITVGGGT